MDNNPKSTTTRESRKAPPTSFKNRRTEGVGKPALNEYHHKYEELKDKTSEIYEESKDTVIHFIQTKPLTSILMAAGVGFILSLLRSHPKDK
jgi:ElaB/YqjD/DUF883 family membrane-anchored ribosome-binding protein